MYRVDKETIKNLLSSILVLMTYPRTHLLDAIIQGHCGQLWLDHPNQPNSGVAIIGKYAKFVYLLGNVDKRVFRMFKHHDAIFVPMTVDWQIFLDQKLESDLTKFQRFLMKCPENFDLTYLNNIVRGLDQSFKIQEVNQSSYEKLLVKSWSQDLVGNFDNFEECNYKGRTVVVTKHQEIVSGAGTFAPIPNGIEIEIDTHPEYQRRGLAKVAGAKLILTCLRDGLIPSWDAHTEISKKLAESLGYHVAFTYDAYERIGKDI